MKTKYNFIYSSKKFISATIKRLPDMKSLSVIDHKAYVWYREKSKIANRKLIENYVDYGKVISEFYKIAGEHLVENTSGIFLEGLGYIGICSNYTTLPKQKTFITKITTKDPVWISYIPITKNKADIMFSMDLSFAKKIRKSLSENIKKKKYLYYFTPSVFFNHLRRKTYD